VPLAPAALTGARGGELLARVRVDVDELQGVFVRLVAPTAVAVLAGTAAVASRPGVHDPGGGAAGPAAGARGAGAGWSRSAGRRAVVETARADAAYGSDTLDLLRGLADQLTGDGGAGALRSLDASLAAQEAAERSTARLASVTTFLRDGVPALGCWRALWLVGHDVAAGRTDPVLLAAAALGVLGAFEAVSGLGLAWSAAPAVAAAADRVRALGEQRPAVTEAPEPGRAPASSRLRLEAVTLTYPGASHPALAAFDLDVLEGEKVALTGPSGAGKTSVLSLLLRARDPDSGRVLLGGTDLRALALADVRARTAWAPQTAQVLGGSLAANLRLGRHDASDDELAAALREVGLDGLLDTVGLHGWVGESGERLSAGERAPGRPRARPPQPGPRPAARRAHRPPRRRPRGPAARPPGRARPHRAARHPPARGPRRPVAPGRAGRTRTGARGCVAPALIASGRVRDAAGPPSTSPPGPRRHAWTGCRAPEVDGRAAGVRR
jgi:ABC-type transport system involved in cytochrome bd biosynthesis fused ATPase/permease subunit